MTDRLPRSEWPYLMDFNNFRLASDPTRDMRTWCEWRVDLNNAICRDGRTSKVEQIRELIKRTNRREQGRFVPQDPRKARPTMQQFLLVNFGLPRVSKLPPKELQPKEYKPRLPGRPEKRPDFH